MNILDKLKISELSAAHLCFFREGKSLRLYQGALLWAEQHGLPMVPKCRVLKSARGGRLLLGELNESKLLSLLHERGFTPMPVSWGWRVTLPQERCLRSAQQWVETQVLQLPALRWRPHKEEVASSQEQLQELLDELRNWPVTEMPPIQAVKAIRRWQERLTNLSLLMAKSR